MLHLRNTSTSVKYHSSHKCMPVPVDYCDLKLRLTHSSTTGPAGFSVVKDVKKKTIRKIMLSCSVAQ